MMCLRGFKFEVMLRSVDVTFRNNYGFKQRRRRKKVKETGEGTLKF